MAVRKFSTLLAVVAAGAAAGMIGSSLTANAGAPKASLSDKTLYGKANPSFTQSMDQVGGTPTTVLEVTIHAPAAGTASLDINSQIWADFPANNTASTLIAEPEIGRCSAPDTLSTAAPANCANVVENWFEKYPNSNTGTDATYTYAINSQLSFPGAGDKTVYLNVGTFGYPAGLISGAHVQVAFTPNNPISNSSHITVSAVAPGSGPFGPHAQR